MRTDHPTILLVDDEPAIRDSVKRVLKNDDLMFLEAGDGKEALDILDQTAPNLILLDLQMPRMNGFSFLKEFRGSVDGRLIPVCVMTGSSEIDDRRRAIDLGADDFVQKPTQVVELKTRIKSLLRIGRYQRELHDLNAVLEKKVQERTSELRGTVEQLEHAKRETELAYRETVLRLTMAAEAKDKCTSAHLERMSHYAALLAEKCGWRAADTDLLLEAAKLHDIGKLGIPDTILGKAGKLTEPEIKIMRKHAEIGADILSGSKSKLLRMGAQIALTHHERFDGTGYPRGLKGKTIPEVGRIVAIADVFDALMTHRSYKRAWSLEASVAAMSDEAGKHFDPDLLALFLDDIDALCEIHARFDEGSKTQRPPLSPDSIILVSENLRHE